MSSDLVFAIERAVDKLTDEYLDRVVKEMEEEEVMIDRLEYEEAMEMADIREAIEYENRFTDYDLAESCGLPPG